MEKLQSMASVFSDPATAWRTVQEQGRHVLDLVKAHPWTSLGVATGTALLWSYVRAPRNLPPGPMGIPAVGALSCFTEELGQRMFEWRKQYGDLVSFYRMGRLYIILNNEKNIRDTFVKQSDLFSHRDNGETMTGLGLEDEIFAAPFNETWKKNKKFALTTLKHYGFGTPKSENTIHEQIESLKDFIIKAKGSPLDLSEQLRYVCAGTISSIVFGGNASWDDPAIRELVELNDRWYGIFGEAAMLLDYYDKYFPRGIGGLFTRKQKKDLSIVNTEFVQFLTEKIHKAASDLSERESDCVIDVYIKERGTEKKAVDVMAKTVMIFLPDAIDTASILDTWCLLYTTYYPEIQEKIKEEVDAVCGSSRTPTIGDRVNMPYTQAAIHEVIRMILLSSLSSYRELHQDVTLEGYNLPKGSLVAANFYAVHFDPEIFPEPEKFKPDRFIDGDGKFDSSLAGKIMTFSVGGRKCLGESYYKVHVFFLLTSIFQHFDLEFDPSAPRPTLEKDTSSIVYKPDEFKLCFKPR